MEYTCIDTGDELYWVFYLKFKKIVSHPKYLLPNLYVGTSTVLGLFSSMTAHYLKEAIQIKKTWLYVGEK